VALHSTGTPELTNMVTGIAVASTTQVEVPLAQQILEVLELAMAEHSLLP